MYLFYVDESGTLDPEVEGTRADGTTFEKEWIYSLTAFGLFEHKWRHFYNPIVSHKRHLIRCIEKRAKVQLALHQCEMKSTWIRIPKQREKHPFLSRLADEEIRELVETYYRSLENLPVRLFSVVVDKRHLRNHMDRQQLHRKAWELLCERIELFMREFHSKHKALLVADDLSKQDNISLTMKHAYFLEHQTSAGLDFKNIIETPFFVRSELSEGVQFADLCSYNIYRAFRHGDWNYGPFLRLLPRMYFSQNTHTSKIDGLKVFPNESPLVDGMKKIKHPLDGCFIDK
ncbi:hypothetical protein DPQ33_17705 [Oceanidesulfovibrio indonesiensis]|uniref:DUF3800 domain-containing protein n=1 Tax=Oceanidesulfovibrio indonesiensis TaxID=54767 RepID=A0A7M3MA44_9BACT|nr:DUF3800 domain-containing protein [Oceanidesulfovibrio indonesiensis]TVM14229.1 hypothetical protein DPQ33_17705 [Oceanidesulfovibrio indonesiensis]